MVAVKLGFGLQIGEIGAGVGFGKALAPDFFGAENFGDEAGFLRVGAAGDDSGADEAEAERVGHGRSFNAGHFFPEERLLHERGAAAAVFFGPGDSGPAAVVEFALPGAKVGIGFFEGLFAPVGPVFGGVGGEPGAEFIAEAEFFGG